MKKVISKEVELCDKCGKENYLHPCLKCGVEHCWECQKTEGISYNHGVGVCGSGDGYYCNKCDAELRANKSDELHQAYLTIQSLRTESENFYKEFKVRSEMAEQKIKELNSD